jgi:hypothetical protein
LQKGSNHCLTYQRYRAVFERQGFPVFDGMDMGVLGINVLKNSR